MKDKELREKYKLLENKVFFLENRLELLEKKLKLKFSCYISGKAEYTRIKKSKGV